jgi:hypothetical protein
LGGLGAWFFEMTKFFRSENDRHYRLLGGTIAIGTLMFAIFALFYDLTIPFWILVGLGTALVNIRNPHSRKVVLATINSGDRSGYNRQLPTVRYGS